MSQGILLIRVNILPKDIHSNVLIEKSLYIHLNSDKHTHKTYQSIPKRKKIYYFYGKMSSSKVITNVCLQLNKSVVGQLHPFGLLSGPLYMINLLAMVFSWTSMYTDSIAKRIIHVCLQLIKSVVGLPWPFGATVWATVQDKVAGICIFMVLNVYRFHCKKRFPCMSSAE